MNMMARFNDGKSSVTVLSQIKFTHKGLEVMDADSIMLAYIPYTDLVIIEELVDSLPGIIGSKDEPDIRIEVDNPTLFKHIATKTNERRRSSYIRLSWVTITLLFALVITGVALMFKYHSYSSRIIAQSIPQSWDDQLGQYVAHSLTKDSSICQNKQGQMALEKLVSKLVDASGHKTKVTVAVIDDDTVNAFAISGNQIYVYNGLITSAKNYEELAGVLAHEIGHLLKRHPTEGLIQTLSLNLLFKMIGGGSGQIEYFLTASNLFLVLHYSRSHELEADDIAIRILNKVGIGGNGLLLFFNTVESKEKDALGKYHTTVKPIEKFLSTHPLTEDRIKFINEHSIKQPKTRMNMISKAEWKQIQNICPKPKTAEPAKKSKEK